MKVKDLIKRLKKYDGDVELVVEGDDFIVKEVRFTRYVIVDKDNQIRRYCGNVPDDVGKDEFVRLMLE